MNIAPPHLIRQSPDPRKFFGRKAQARWVENKVTGKRRYNS
jgi:hypothetical protein